MKKLSQIIFKYRSYTPIPLLILMLIFQKPTLWSLIIGFLIALIGEAFRMWGVIYAGSETRTTGSVGGTFLVISGAFGHLRNPLYLGNIFLYTGVGIMSMALFPYLQIFAILFFFLQYRIIIINEEEYLSKTFGQEYKAYAKAVPRFIPRIRKYKSAEVEQPPINLKAGFRSEKNSLQAFASITLILIVLFILRNS